MRRSFKVIYFIITMQFISNSVLAREGVTESILQALSRPNCQNLLVTDTGALQWGLALDITMMNWASKQYNIDFSIIQAHFKENPNATPFFNANMADEVKAAFHGVRQQLMTLNGQIIPEMAMNSTDIIKFGTRTYHLVSTISDSITDENQNGTEGEGSTYLVIDPETNRLVIIKEMYHKKEQLEKDGVLEGPDTLSSDLANNRAKAFQFLRNHNERAPEVYAIFEGNNGRTAMEIEYINALDRAKYNALLESKKLTEDQIAVFEAMAIIKQIELELLYGEHMSSEYGFRFQPIFGAGNMFYDPSDDSWPIVDIQ